MIEYKHDMFDEKQLRKTIALMKPDGQLFEVRLIFNNKAMFSGYFTGADELISAFRELNVQGECNVYITLNSINPACYDRQQKNIFCRNAKITTSDNDIVGYDWLMIDLDPKRPSGTSSTDEECYDRQQKNIFCRNAKITTSDNDIVGYDWLMIDLDPKRPSGTSSTDEELQEAKELGNKVFQFMRNLGFSKPLFANSGNGVHLLYKIRLKNTKENQELVKKSLKTLGMLFTSAKIDLDLTNFNPSRICKLYGTKAQKGANSELRSHRMSFVIGEPEEIVVNDIKYLEKLCDLYPKEEKPQKYNNYHPRDFDLEEWMSKYSMPEEIVVNDIKYLEKLCDLYPKEEKPQKYNNYHPRDFDLEEWMSKYSIRYTKSSYADGTKYILDCCPFDMNHKGKDACIFQSRTGAIGFHCFHNSCADKTWKDVRMLFEPDAYEKRQQEYEKKIYSKSNKNVPKKIEETEGKPLFFTAMDILNMPKKEETFIKSGIKTIDDKMRGLKKSYISVISGLRASGKSSIISEICLDCVEAKNRVGVFSGELAPKNFMRWMNLQAAGKGYVEGKSSIISEICLDCVEAKNRVGVFSGELAPKNFMRWMNLQAAGKGYVEPTQFDGYYNVNIDRQRQIAKWLGKDFFLYNNEYGNDFSAIIEEFKKKIENDKLDLLILDNLMAFNISSLSDNKWDAQTEFVLSLKRLAVEKDIHIVFVAHPRKAMGFLRLDDISGTGDLGNAVDNAFIVHRVNNDFIRLTKQTFGLKDDNELYQASNVIEIAKDRDGGLQDVFVPLFYEKESKRLKNTPVENKIYGWNKEDDGFSSVENLEIPFEE